METINATRMNLLLKWEEVKTALTGAELLRNKRDVLLTEFFSTLKGLMALREALDNQGYQATRSLVFALGLEGKEKLISFSFLSPKKPSFKIKHKNLLGLEIPELILESEGDESDGDFIGIDAGPLIAETKEIFQDFLRLALQALPQEVKLKRLGQEIKNTTRKVNSLEKYVIPHIRGQVKFIRETLEEREREDIFRLKKLKRRLAR